MFADRTEAGEVLAERLARYADEPDVVVLALPRGGVPVAAVVAAALGAPLDVLVVRKLGVPGHPELAMGAIATGGVGEGLPGTGRGRRRRGVRLDPEPFRAVGQWYRRFGPVSDDEVTELLAHYGR